MSRLRVAVLTPDVAGSGRSARPSVLLASALSTRHDVELLSVRDGGTLLEAPAAGVRLRRGPAPRTEGASPSRLVAEDDELRWTEDDDASARLLLDDLDADALVTTSPGTLAAAAQLLPPGVRLVHHHHRADPLAGRGGLLLRAFGARADAITVLDDHAAARVRSALGAAAPRVVVVPHAVPVDWRPPAAPHLDPATGLVLAVAPLEGDQQLLQLLHAFVPLASAQPGWRLRVVGRGPRRRELLGTARRLGLHDQVELAHWSRDPATEWARATLGVSTARVTPWGAPAADALRAGVPFVAQDVPGGTRRLVLPGVTGALTVGGSAGALGAALERLAADPEQHARLAAGALAHGRRLAGSCAQEWDAVLQGVVGIAAPDPAPPAAPHEAPGARPTAVAPADARRAALELVVAAADRGARDWFVLPRPFPEPVRVVVPEERRTAVLQALAAARAPAWLGGRLPAAGARAEVRGTVAGAAEDALGGAVGALAVGPVPAPWHGGPGAGGPGDATDAGHAGAHDAPHDGGTVLLEFWPRSSSGRLLAVDPDALVPSLPVDAPVVTVTVEGVEVPVPEPFQHPTTWDFTEPVDVVWTWVDGSDPAWDAARRARLGGDASTRDRRSSGQARFTSRDELRYSMRSVHLFAPWVRTLHLVTAGQRPSWLADHPRVRVVDHREILPPEALPTFSSHAIETGLHRVPGLSEHFVYLNDDVLLARPLGVGTFFGPGGSAATFAGRGSVGVPDADDAPYLGAAFTNRRLLLEAFGTVAVRQFAHAPHPHRVSVLREIGERFPEALERTALSPFRAADDVSLLSSLAQQYGLRTGRAHPAELELAHIDITRATLHRELQALRERRRADALCLADGHDWAFEPGVAEAEVAGFLEAYYPVAAPWERG